MSGMRFVLTLGALLLLFIGGGYAIDHWPQLTGAPQPATQATTTPGTGGTIPNAGRSEGVATAPASDPAAATGAEADTVATPPETKMKKEFDTTAADAAAEAEANAEAADSETASATTVGSDGTRSVGASAPEVTASIDSAVFAPAGSSVVAGKALPGTTVTLLANGQILATAVSDESGEWIMIIEEPLPPGTYKLSLSAVGPNGGDAVVSEVGETTIMAPAEANIAEAQPSGQGDTSAAPAVSTSTASTEPAVAETTTADATAPATGSSGATTSEVSTSTTGKAADVAQDTAGASAADVIVPSTETFDVASVPPDLIAPEATPAEASTQADAPPAPSSSETTPSAGAATDTAAVEGSSLPPVEPGAPNSDSPPTAARTTSEAQSAEPEPLTEAPTPTEAEQPTRTAEATQVEQPTETAQATGTTPATEPDPSLVDQAGDAAQAISDMFTDWLTATSDEAEAAAKTFSLTSATYKPIAQGKGVVTLSGRGPPKAEVRIFVDKVAVGVTSIADSGRWLADADHWIEPGPHVARAEIIGTDGAVVAGHDLAFASAAPPEVVASAAAGSSETEAAPAATPILLAIADVAYENMGPKKGRITVSGRSEPTAQVTVYANGLSIGTTAASETGDWSLASDTWLDTGAHAIRAERAAANGEIIESTLSEFVRPAAEAEVASAETAVGEAQVASVDDDVSQPAVKRHKKLKKSRKTKIAALAMSPRKVRKVRKHRSRYKTVTLHSGRKGKPQVLGYMRRRGPGWIRVKRGDSLWRIADRCYGDGRHYPVIVAANRKRIRNPDLIYPRQRIYVP